MAGAVALPWIGRAGGLGLTATTAVALWFHCRRGMAVGIVSALGSLGISSTPLVLEYLLLDLGWRTAWRTRGFSTAQAAANFVPQTVAGLVATLGAGYLMDRFAGRWMIVAREPDLGLTPADHPPDGGHAPLRGRPAPTPGRR